jgi:hypothetical protein
MVEIWCPESRLRRPRFVPMRVLRVSSLGQDSMGPIRLRGSHVPTAHAFRPFGLIASQMRVINNGEQRGE